MPLKNFSNSFSTSHELRTTIRVALFLSFFFFGLQSAVFCLADSATAESGMVVTQHPLATEAALGILKRGGNAVDAAITAQLVLNVVEPESSGVGGGGFFLYYDHIKRSVKSLDGRETAPASAYPEMFLENGKPVPFSPDRITGARAVGVPGTPALIQKIYDQHASGVFTLAQLVEPAVKLAEEGVPVSKKLSEKLLLHANRLAQFPETKKIFFRNDELPLQEGDRLRQPDLARTLKIFGEKGAASFYTGEISRAMIQAVSRSSVNPTSWTKNDLKNYAVIEREPIYGTYRGLDVLAPGLPTAGGALLLAALQILENFDMTSLEWDSRALHYAAEAQKLAFMHRTEMGDPEFVGNRSAHLISKDFAKEESKKILPEKTLRSELFTNENNDHTSHLSIMDRTGNLVSWTTTIEAPFGSGITVPGYGFLLNNELTDFDSEPRDTFGNLKPNAPAPGKRPLSSMTPVFIFNKGRPYMILGSPGGTTIPGTVLNVIINRIDFAMTCEEAVQQPRLIYRGGKLEMEPELYKHPLIQLQLELWGHDTENAGTIGNVQAICFDSRHQEIVGVSDPREEGKAAGY